MNDVSVTVVGWVATTPKQIEPDSPNPYTQFRLASTPRYRRDGEWADRPTEWFTVKAWREAALNIAMSLRKGEPAVVHGRLRTHEWQTDAGSRSEMVIEALAVGHDAMRGRSSFARTMRGTGQSDGPDPAEAGPRSGALPDGRADPSDDPAAADPAAAAAATTAGTATTAAPPAAQVQPAFS